MEKGTRIRIDWVGWGRGLFGTVIGTAGPGTLSITTDDDPETVLDLEQQGDRWFVLGGGALPLRITPLQTIPYEEDWNEKPEWMDWSGWYALNNID